MAEIREAVVPGGTLDAEARVWSEAEVLDLGLQLTAVVMTSVYGGTMEEAWKTYEEEKDGKAPCEEFRDFALMGIHLAELLTLKVGLRDVLGLDVDAILAPHQKEAENGEDE